MNAQGSISSPSGGVESGKNDDSNPQQGSGDTRSPKTAKEDEKHVKEMPNGANPRQSMKIPPTLKDSRKLFVGGLPADITNEEFHTFFQQFGKVMDSVVMFDRETRRSRGFGFVTFEDPLICQHLLSLGHEGQDDGGDQPKQSGRLEMRGKLIEVKSAEPKEPSSSRSNARPRVAQERGVPNRMPNYPSPMTMDPSSAAGWPYFSGTYDQYAAANGMHNPYAAAAVPIATGYIAPMYYHPGMNMPAPASGQIMQNEQHQIPQQAYGPNYYPYPDYINDPNFHPHVQYPPAYAFYPHVPVMAAAAVPSAVPQPPLPAAETSSVMQPVAPGIPAKTDSDENENTN